MDSMYDNERDAVVTEALTLEEAQNPELDTEETMPAEDDNPEAQAADEGVQAPEEDLGVSFSN